MTREERALLLKRAAEVIDRFPHNRRAAVERAYEGLAHAITHGYQHVNVPGRYEPWPPVRRVPANIPPYYPTVRRTA